MIEAVVQTGSLETPYRRAGCGSVVLLLAGGPGVPGDALFDHLAAGFRTIAPLRPAGIDGEDCATFELWLRGLVDGLGLQRPAVVAGVADAIALLRFAAVDPYRVDRIALVTHGGSGVARNPVLAGAAAEAAEAPHPLLLVGIPGPDEPDARADALDRLLEFLRAPSAQATTGSRSVW